MPTPAPRQEEERTGPASGELETGSFIENAAARISRWIRWIGDLFRDLAGTLLN